MVFRGINEVNNEAEYEVQKPRKAMLRPRGIKYCYMYRAVHHSMQFVNSERAGACVSTILLFTNGN